VTLEEALNAIHTAPRTHLREAGQVVMAEMERRDPVRVDELEAQFNVILTELEAMKDKHFEAEVAMTDMWKQIEGSSSACETLRDHVDLLITERDRLAGELELERNRDQSELTRLRKLERAVWAMVNVGDSPSPYIRAAVARVMAILGPHLDPAKQGLIVPGRMSTDG